MDCGTAAMPIPAVIFVLGVIITAIVVSRRERLGIKDTLLVLIGMRRFDQSRPVIILLFTTLLAPVALWVILNERCLAAMPPI